MRYSDIETKANTVLEEKNLFPKKGFEIDVYKLAEAFSIRIHEKALGGEASGLLVIKDGKAAIGIELDQIPQRKRFTIAHELGHFFLHREFKNTFVDEVFARSGESNQIEREANAFAASLLMPSSLISKAIDVKGWREIDDEKIEELAELFNVSGISMTYRLVNLKIIRQPNF